VRADCCRQLRAKVPESRQDAGSWPQRDHPRKMLMLAGCVQPAMMPNINSATARVLDAMPASRPWWRRLRVVAAR
jgi:glycolate oxidase iron-sulfur subunit